ncbi:MAG: hypothetical protein ACKO96_19640, partial [Flammeovirgaceae bacterium]
MFQPPADLIEKIEVYFTNHYASPPHEHLPDDVKNLLEHPLLKQFIFSNHIAIIDHSIAGYRYLSDSVVDELGISKADFLEKGFAYSFSLLHPECLTVLFPVFEQVTELTFQLALPERRHIRFNYTYRGKTSSG